MVPAEGPNFLVERNFVSSERLLLCAPLALVSPVAALEGELWCGVVVVVVWCVSWKCVRVCGMCLDGWCVGEMTIGGVLGK